MTTETVGGLRVCSK
ncbi:Protein of unknown function [Escherichia coli D6-117.29]|nr:Protein of unknown function [Escherichia coli D6-117.29]